MEEAKLLTQAVSRRQFPEARQEIDAVIAEIQDANRPKEELVARAGVGAYLLARHSTADSLLSRVSSHSVGLFHHGLALQALGRLKDAEVRFDDAAKAGYDG